METPTLCRTCQRILDAELISCDDSLETNLGTVEEFLFADSDSLHKATAMTSEQHALRYGHLIHDAHPQIRLEPTTRLPERHRDDGREVIVYYLDDLLISAQGHCHFCSILYEDIKTWANFTTDQQLEEFSDQKPASLVDRLNQGILLHLLTGKTTLKWAILPSLLKSGDPSRPHTHSMRFAHLPSAFSWQRYLMPDQSPGSMSPLPHPSAGPGPQTVQRLVSWLRECRTGDHPQCSQRLRPSVAHGLDIPSRLVQIEQRLEGTFLRLLEMRPRSDSSRIPEYVTLSHCWGQDPIVCRLQEQNYTSYLCNIPLDTLPLTFRQAVEFTTLIGFSLLWIDALCIIQDSLTDWSHEAPRMSSIYSNSVVTLAATAVDGPLGGLFVQQNHLTPFLSTVKWAPELGCVEFGPDILGYGSSSGRYLKTPEQCPLIRRAWVFQEELLAARTIHFAADQIYWSCDSAVKCEHKLDDINVEVAQIGKYSWNQLVELYSERCLSFHRDRLVALAGVAKAYADYHRLPRSDYLAGIWKDRYLALSLDWATSERVQVGGSGADEPIKSLGPEDANNAIAPSWSWASVNAPVWWQRDGGSANTRLILRSVSSKNGDVDPFRPAIQLGLTVTAYVHACKVYFADNDLSNSTATHGGVTYKYWEKFTAPPCFQVRGSSSHAPLDIDGVFLPLRFVAGQRNESGSSISGLLLEPVLAKKGVYRRVCSLALEMLRSDYEAVRDGPAGELAEDLYLSKHEDGSYAFELI